MEALNIEQSESIPSDARVCSRHFPDGDALKLPSLSLRKRFASPRKRRAVVRLPLKSKKRLKLSKSSSPSTSIIVSPSAQSTLETEVSTSFQSVEDDSHASISTYPDCVSNDSLIRNQETTNDLQVTLNAALMSRIEVLEQENTTLRRNVIVAGIFVYKILCTY